MSMFPIRETRNYPILQFIFDKHKPKTLAFEYHSRHMHYISKMYNIQHQQNILS